MKTRNAMQLKAKINNRAKEAGVSPQLMLQNYMLERLIDRISRSEYRGSIIIKGGMLIGSLIGVERRTTKDLDTTIQGFELSHETAERVFREISSINVDDDLEFEFIRTEDIRETDEYPGIRIYLKAKYDPLAVLLTIDVTTGDTIVPHAVVYEYPFVFDEGYAQIMAYPLETVLAEKLETILSRNVATTRPRDFYDVYELWHLRREQIDLKTLNAAILATCEKRNSVLAILNHEAILVDIRTSKALKRQWDQYVAKHSYAKEIGFSETIEAIEEVANAVCAYV